MSLVQVLLNLIFLIAQEDNWKEEVKFTDNTHCDMSPAVSVGDWCEPALAWICNDSVYLTHYNGWNETWSEPIRVNPDTIVCNRAPSVWGGWERQLVWRGIKDDHFGIYYYDGNILQLASSADSLGHPDIISANSYLWVVWEGFDGNDWEIFYTKMDYSSQTWDTVAHLTDNEYDDRYPEIGYNDGGPYIVWQEFDGDDWEILSAVWDGNQYEIISVTNNSTQDINPSIAPTSWWSSPPMIAWQGWDGNDYEIYLCTHHGDSCGVPIQLTNNSVNDENSAIDNGPFEKRWGNCIVWQRFDGIDYEIMCYLPEYGDSIIQLSNEDTLDDINPAVATTKVIGKEYLPGICVSWEGFDGNDWEIYYRFGYNTVFGMERGDEISEPTLIKVSPNPAKSITNIQYTLLKKLPVTLRVYDATGRLVKRLVDGYIEPGCHIVKLETNSLIEGVYFLRLNAKSYTATKKLIVL